MAARQPHADDRHEERVLQVPQSLHPERVRQLPVRQPRPVRAGARAVYDHDFSLTGDPQQSARFRVRQFGFYVGDQWRAASNFTLTMGVRADIPTFPDKPTHNPTVEQLLGRNTDEAPTGILWSPRVGFNYSLSDANREQIRGGIGVFAGRTPYVWLSNQYGSTGMEFQRLSRDVRRHQAPTVRSRRQQPAEDGRRRRRQRNQPDRPGLQVPVADAEEPRLRPRARGHGPGRQRRVPLLAERQRREVPEPEHHPFGRDPHTRWPHRVPAPGELAVQQRHRPDQQRPGGCVDDRVQARAALPQSLLRERVVPLRRVHLDPGRHVVAGDVELAERLQPGGHQQPAADAVQLRSGSPHHRVGLVRDPDAGGPLGARRRLLQRPVGSSVVGELQRRRQQRRHHDQRPALHSDGDRPDHLHERHCPARMATCSPT